MFALVLLCDRRMPQGVEYEYQSAGIGAALFGAAVTAQLRRVAVALVATTVAVVGAIVVSPDDALAACSPATGSNVTVNCTGTTFNQGPGINTGYGDSTQNGLTLTVQSGASVTGTSTGIDVNNNNTINNLGTITTQGSGGIGMCSASMPTGR